jgi:hypothetical protein
MKINEQQLIPARPFAALGLTCRPCAPQDSETSQFPEEFGTRDLEKRPIMERAMLVAVLAMFAVLELPQRSPW